MNNRPKPPMGMKPKQKMDKKTVKRLLSYFGTYKLQFTFVLICIVISAVAGVLSSLFLQTLIDDYIEPLLIAAAPNFSGLLRMILVMAGIYLIGVLALSLIHI